MPSGDADLAGELTAAFHADGSVILEFTKTPLALVVVHIGPDFWQLNLVAENRSYRGRGDPPAALGLARPRRRARTTRRPRRMALASDRPRPMATGTPTHRGAARGLPPPMNDRLRSRWLLLVLLLPALIGLSRLRFNVEVLDLLPADVPAVQGLKSYQQHFANTRELIITLEGTDAAQVELAAGALATRLTRDLDLAVQWEAPWHAQPQAIAELLAFVWFNQPPAEVARLAQRLAPQKLRTVARTVAGSPRHFPLTGRDRAAQAMIPSASPCCRLPPRAICPTSEKAMKCSPPRMEPSGCCMSRTGPRSQVTANPNAGSIRFATWWRAGNQTIPRSPSSPSASPASPHSWRRSAAAWSAT